ncbi:hybrid sensor histidine kinase/response regulator [Cupriavidus sp. D384]|uniref:hybrid sensor histidine kinase/response regulator n=1 Tax=Cupriavidus sp. D384 TaxID=1538095 RepID=UPI000837419E|nr:hybrid sensor histidine kinase/response regulator [Cupriavidus sp. D384]
MQQILDRTQQSLAQSFAALARNARRQQHLYYATVGLLIAIIIVSGLLLAGLAAARHLDVRRSHVAQYVSSISLKLQSQTSFLRRTALTVDYYLAASSDAPPDPDLLAQIRRTGAARSHDGKYVLLMPEAARRALGDTLPHKVWQLQQIATATLTTGMAFGLDAKAYVVAPDASFAILVSPAEIDDATMPDADFVTRLRDDLARHAPQTADRADREERSGTGPAVPRWIGPVDDPVQHTRAMMATLDARGANSGGQATVVAASIPARTFLAGLARPADPATLWLVNRSNDRIDVSPDTDASLSNRILRHASGMPPDTPGATRDGLLLVQQLDPAFGTLVYLLSYGTLLHAISAELLAILGAGLVLIICIVLTARYWDIHLLRRSHAEAARSLENETISHILVSATPIGLCIVRQHDESILTSNAVADSLLGHAQGARMPAYIMDALRNQGALSGRAQLASIVQVTVPAASTAGGDSTAASLSQPPVAPPRQFLQVTCAPARYRDEAVLFCAIQDITAQHQLEQQLRGAREAAEAMMRARSNFFASMSHEIRTPLNALLGNLELLARADGLEAQAPRLRALQMASDGLQRIVNDILDFSKIDAGEMKLVKEPFRPIDDLESLSMSYSPMVQGKPIRFYVHLSPTLDTVVTGDRTRIAQIINNLLSNAFKFTLCGKITLSAEITTDTQDRNVLICRVRDSGIGMPPALVARIFHPFVQGEASTSARYGGTGLGLSICARLTELMNGHITVESVEGVGSAFTVVVPLGEAAKPVAAPEPLTRGTRALILCQEIESGTMLQAWLERAGWRCDVFHQLGAAQAWLRANRSHIFVVTGEYGLDTIEALRQLHPANVVWVTRDGPERPADLGQGVFEVSTFSHSAILMGTIAALNAEPAETGTSTQDGGRDDIAEPHPALARAGVSTGSGNAPRRAILVAEDNALNQTLIAEQLVTLGWDPVVVGDGRQALSSFEHGHFEAVLTDVHMPVMDGYELLAAIRAIDPVVPVLAFSAVTRTEQTGEWKHRGFTGHIAKPASLMALEQALQAIPGTVAVNHPDAQGALPANGKEDKPPIPGTEIARYQTMLLEHLRSDGPELAAILLRHDAEALCHWAHRSAGAFLVVDAQRMVQLCRQVESLCGQATSWTPEIAAAAAALHDAVRAYCDEATGLNA